MTPNKLILLISFIILFLLFISIPLRISIVQKKTGALVEKLNKKLSPKFILIYMLGFLLIVFAYAINFSPLYQGILCACALLGEEYVMREFAFSGKNGLYENGLISGGQFTLYSDIKTILIHSDTVLVINVYHKPDVNMFFETKEQRDSFLELIKNLVSDIKIQEINS